MSCGWPAVPEHFHAFADALVDGSPVTGIDLVHAASQLPSVVGEFAQGLSLIVELDDADPNAGVAVELECLDELGGRLPQRPVAVLREHGSRSVQDQHKVQVLGAGELSREAHSGGFAELDDLRLDGRRSGGGARADHVVSACEQGSERDSKQYRCREEDAYFHDSVPP
ncbi:hypothetical protein A3H80_01350 [Candidatus Roizmanbacteria bacterium RIFCSPLOWO2_02_FULL_37_19]|uniref:Uncharacterized protein n=1 Tax=Candidatus Roizmanbacteria bacterium RIFCSPHIGHO2_02_FULL_37_24 TaxID=1802037 RepID=A0A1F7GWS4_9BACT|nr:MAG: hypothetical protein A2862_01375 [Candidatus Roizmanbacteria bacterium RIFCSPHIGHO2_01_FULL_38_41]OGK23016.1 MAG: hypothetical protein A3C24_02655 [Candidatus Roizmanbacteria bacterium RIFCSPHIGHO2_02_FULL_37_24]OGK32759.1 MAG: hypothetical protein A3E10_01180 [Candidatus Roizmanbacteria bacterium RIFCSPHIGHO2_12_FULL_37_23]OGK53837.1 MAG: hypothetical protein A3H80_01350 [Candidatus Roizmanbacteria bacterium RIFCSPLOWO2_02_FULL_37_19]